MDGHNRLDIRQEIPVRSFFICCYVCNKHRDPAEYLLLRRAGGYLHGLWQPVTGRIEKGEKAWQAALREVEEEAGLVPEELYSANFVQMFYDIDKDGINIVPVFIAFVADDAQPILSEEHSDLCWLPAEPAREHVYFPQQRDTLTRIEQEFVQRPPMEFLRIDFDW